MRHRILALISVLVVVIAAGIGVACNASTNTAKTADSTKTWVAPRTAWGDPDLQGTWENLTPVPLERSKQFGNREFMTEQEAAERAKRAGATSTSGTPSVPLPRGEAEEISGTLADIDKARNANADNLPNDTPGKRIVDAEIGRAHV